MEVIFATAQSKHRRQNLFAVPATKSKAEMVADEITGLYKITAGNVGAEQALHMIQCAVLAMENFSDLPLIIAALVHNIDALTVNAESLSLRFNEDENPNAAYLRATGFSERVCAIVENQGLAERYLLASKKSMHNTAQCVQENNQALTAEEKTAFANLPYFSDTIQVCRWRIEAKEKPGTTIPINFFRRIIWDHLYYRI